MSAGEWRSRAAWSIDSEQADRCGMSDDMREARSALARAEAGERGWAEATRLQRSARPDHADFYALAASLVPTLYALEDLAELLRGQVGGYGAGRAVYDDTYTYDPAGRLADAAEHLALLRDALVVAHGHANRFWSAIGHIGVEAES